MIIPDPDWNPPQGSTAPAPMVLIDNPDCMIPVDASMISHEWHQALLDGQSAGKVICEDAEGHPVLADPPPQTPEQLAEQERYWRDSELRVTDEVVTRHRDELEDGTATTLTALQYTDLQVYRRALRNWPESGEFPSIDRRPAAPQWLAEQRQSFSRLLSTL
jgi:hypothetical protein